MFSKLEPLFKTTFRQAESTDTRQAIRRDESKSGRKNSDDNTQQDEDNDLWTDSTIVSVAALKAFLTDFLKEQIDSEKQQQEESASITDAQTQVAENTLARKAHSAYETSAHYADAYSKRQTDGATPPPSQEIPADLLDNEDVRIMNKLIVGLQTLESRNVTELNIQREGTFLESLEKAVKNAL
jgi:hypothetical protein